MSSQSTTGLLLSGGLDSSILLGHLLRGGRQVQPFYVRSGLAWEDAELAAAERFLAAMASPRLERLVVLRLPLADVYGDHWSVTGRDVPDAQSDDAAVYLPGRNALLLVKPAVWCRLHGIGAAGAGRAGVEPVRRRHAEFFGAFEAALGRATAGRVRSSAPSAR